MSYTSTLTLTLPDAYGILDAQITHLAEHELYPTNRDNGYAQFESHYGRFSVTATTDDFEISVTSDNESGLEILMQFIADYLLDHVPGLTAEQILWNGYKTQSTHPANFREMRVIGKSILGPGMIRITLQGQNLDSFARDGLHFRLLIPAASDRQPVWPRKLPSGQIRYPDPPDHLYNRVYTIRHIRPDRGELDVDLVRHPGGIASDWAENVEAGARVGILGPGGGYFPQADWLLMGGDETALPAIARILENANPETKGEVFIALRDPSHRLNLHKPDGVSVSWLDERDDQLPQAVEGVTLPRQGQVFAWFGGEQQQASRLRKHFKATLGLPPKQQLSVAYWRRE